MFGVFCDYICVFILFGEEWNFDEDHIDSLPNSGNTTIFILLTLGFMSMGELSVVHCLFLFSLLLRSFHSRSLCSLCSGLFLNISVS